MDDQAHKSCWGVTVWAVVGFAAILLVVNLFGSQEAAMIAAGS